MMYPALLSSEDHDAEALSVVDIRPGLRNFKDLSSEGKMALRGSETQENNLVVDADGCVDNLEVTADDSEVQQSKPQRNNIYQHQDEETPTSVGYSSRVLACFFNAKVSVVLFFLLMAVCHGAGTCPKHENFHVAAGVKVRLRFICPVEHCLLKFHNSAENRDGPICDGRRCDEESGYTFDEDSLCFTSDNKTEGLYSLVDFNTTDVVYCIELTIKSTAAERQILQATSNTLPSVFLMVLTIVLGYVINQKLTG